MMKKIWLSAAIMLCCFQSNIGAHCQMPCGIYHDDMVFDQVDQYIETVVKGITVLEDNKFSSVQDRNEFIRWVIQKENMSNETAHLITTYFLQQKIKPGEEDTPKRLESAHKLLFLLVLIKQSSGLGPVNDFYEEWERFKLMFHIEGYECKMEQIKLKKWAEKQKQAQEEAKGNNDSQQNANNGSQQNANNGSQKNENNWKNGSNSNNHSHDHGNGQVHNHTHSYNHRR